MNTATSGSIKYTVLKKIDDSPPHSIFFISDFSFLGAPETIRKILREATMTGRLEKASHGIYFKPKISRFGKVPLTLEKIAGEISARDWCKIQASGSTAANIIGLSTQVPMNLSYITTGSTRTVNIGKRKIILRHAAPKNFEAKGTVVPLLIQGMKEIGKENLSEAEYDVIRKFIDSHPDPHLQEDLQLAPVWIQQIIKKIMRS